MKAVVLGAGIGGLATAIGLHLVGAGPVVLERAQALEEVGAGIGLTPNAVCALERLGVADAVRVRAERVTNFLLRSWRGEALVDFDCGAHGWEFLATHRSDLQRALLAALGDVVIRVGAACAGLREEEGGVRALIESGGDEAGDVLVAADGIDSVARRILFGPSEPAFTGSIGWRAVVRVEPAALRNTFTETWGPGGLRFGLSPIGAGRLCWYMCEPAREAASGPFPSRKAELLAKLRGWHEPIEATVEATPEEAIFGTGIYELRPLPRWTKGHVALLGDAAHAMTPDLTQGGAQALEDAVVLASCLRGAADVPAALARYESLRRARTKRLAARSRQAARLAHLAHPLGARLRDRLVAATPERLQVWEAKRLLDAKLPNL